MKTHIDKNKLVALLNTQFQPCKDDSNLARFYYQTGRNMLAEYLLMEIAFGTLDVDDVPQTR